MDDWMTPELLADFLAEAREAINKMEPLLVCLEATTAEPIDSGVVASIFRGFHTIKGNAAFLEFDQIVRTTHQAESLLDAVRSGKLELTPIRVACLLDTIDFMQKALESIDTTGSDEACAVRSEQLVIALKAAIQDDSSPAMPPQTPIITVSSASETVAPSTMLTPEEEEMAHIQEAVAEPLPAPQVVPFDSPPMVESDDSDLVTEPPESSHKPTVQTTSNSKSQGDGDQHASIRVDLSKLDELMNLVGELIIAESMVTNNGDLQGLELESFDRASVQLHHITRSLQDLAMAVRMVPVRSTFRRMFRVVRDVARKRGRSVELVLVGEDTEVDRTVIEQITDPLVHLIRNGIDHGIEAVEDRIAKGKPAKGTLRLEARHEAGEVWIVLSDDGNGLDAEKILARARERGLINLNVEPSEKEIFDLIFEPGFSTAASVTNISGRGVGMDVVRQNITDLRGQIEVSSELGKGTTFSLRIPLTLAIIDGMVCRLGTRSYTIPLFAVREIIRPRKTDVRTMPGGSEVVLVRGVPHPVVRLHALHGIPGDPRPADECVFLVLESGSIAIALLVDQVLGQYQAVIKPLPEYLHSMPGIAGCSLMGSGEISLIMDVKGLIQTVRGFRTNRLKAKSLPNSQTAVPNAASSTP